MCAVGILVSCGFGHNTGSELKDTPASDAVTQVNPKAFNAFNIWRDGQGSEILDYPQGYEIQEGTTEADGVFYVNEYVSVPTEGAKVVNDVLEYPARNGKQLKLKFTAATPTEMNHNDAVAHCKQQGLRLPTIREVFDFCAAGTLPNAEGNFDYSRCNPDDYPWSASVDTNDRDQAWLFDPQYGFVYSDIRSGHFYVYNVRCVGPAD